ncbi:hypothetical protein HKBW3S42_01865, partial [Candidatus Hakubella thermalkaliphila]
MKTKKSGSELFFDVFESPVGRLFLFFSGTNLAGVSLEKPYYRIVEAPESFKKELRNNTAVTSEVFKQGYV